MTAEKKLTIAVDGHSSCGKSTLAKAIAKELSYIYVDSGAMYRGIALFCKRNGLLMNGIPDVPKIESILDDIDIHFELNENTGSQDLILNGENVEKEIRSPEIAAVVSPVAAIATVRKKLVQIQRELGKNGGIVMDGRDIGSVVFPNAEVKFFVTADPETRAKRRFLELQAKGVTTSVEETMQNLLERDKIDSTRTESPLIQTNDAILLDNSSMNREEQLEFALKKINQKMEEHSIISNRC